MITLTTDFALKDPFVGMMKGVILGIHPEARIIDLTHGITAHNVQEAALSIARSFIFFPQGTTHLVVVDPGAGSLRRGIAASAHGHRFVGPDNGVLSGVLGTDPRARVFHLNETEYFLKGAGGSFDGRDVFAPIAAWLDLGKGLDELGELITDPATLDLPSPQAHEGSISGQIIHIDTFGNAITNIRSIDLQGLGEGPFHVKVKGAETGIVRCYADGRCDILHALINSSNLLEIFLDHGSAASVHELVVGDPVEVTT